MTLDIILTFITLAVAVVGTLWHEPSRRAKQGLIGLAVLASVASVVKAWNDETDKTFNKRVLTTLLVPSNAAFKYLIADVDEYVQPRKFNNNVCRHDGSGMACFLGSKTDKERHGTLVLNNAELAVMYGNELANTKQKNHKVVEDACEKEVDPSLLEEDFKDKVGIVGSSTYSLMYGRGVVYNYSDDVMTVIDHDGRSDDIGFKSEELTALKKERACDLFFRIETGFREKFAAVNKTVASN